MKSQNTNLKLIVGNATTASSAADITALLAGGAEGEVRVFSHDGTAAASGKKFMFAAIKNGKLDRSEAIDPANILKVSALPYVAPTERVEYIGFNGTSGSIDEITNNLYQVNIELFNYGSLSTENRYLRFGYYESSNVVTQELVAAGITSSIIRNFARERVKRVIAERVIANAGSAIGTTGVVTFVEGQSIAVAATGVGNLVVGDYVRVGGTTDQTLPVYKVVKISGNSIHLDVPYQGVTAAVAQASLQRIAAATAASAAFGVKISGWEQHFDAGKFRFEPVDFRVTLVDFGDTDVTMASAATKGRGAGKIVAEEEWFAEGNFGEIHRMGPQPHLYSSDLVANPAANYHVISMVYQHVEEPAFAVSKSPRMINVYVNATNTTAINGLIASLNTVGLGLATL